MKRLALLLCLIPSFSSAATLFLKTAGGNWGAAGTWSNVNAGGVDNSGPPTLADDAIAELLSGNLQVTASTHVCRSFSGTAGTGNWAGTMSHTAGITLTVASTLTFTTGMTYLIGNSATSAISFLGNNSTGTITFAGKKAPTLSLGGGGTVWTFADSVFSTNTAQTVTFTSGTLHLDGASDNSALSHTIGSLVASNANVRYLLGGASSTTLTNGGVSALSINITTNLVYSAGTSTFCFTGAAPTININSAFTFYSVVFSALTGLGAMAVSNNIYTFTLLSIASGAGVGGAMRIGGNFTVTGILTMAGNSINNRLHVASGTSGGGATVGTQRTFTVTGATVTASNLDLSDMNFSPSQNFSGITGLAGNCGGNANVSFTTTTTQTNSGTASFAWSSLGAWTSRVPLCHDDVVVNGAFISGRTITWDMPRLGQTIDMSGATWSGTAPTISNATGNTINGSFTASTNAGTGLMLWTGNNGLTFFGRSPYTVTTGGMGMGTSVTINAPGGTMTQQDAFSTAGFPLSITNGTWDCNGFNTTASGFTLANTAGAAATMRGGIWTGTGTGVPWNVGGVNFSVSAGTSAIFFSNTSASAKTFTGGTKTYYDVIIASSPTAGETVFSGNNTFHDMIFRAPKTIRFTVASTQTLTGNMYTDSVVTSSVTLASTTGSLAFLAASTPNAHRQCLDAMSIGTVRATPSIGIWYAGDNSASVGSQENWSFTSCYKQSNFLMM